MVLRCGALGLVPLLKQESKQKTQSAPSSLLPHEMWWKDSCHLTPSLLLPQPRHSWEMGFSCSEATWSVAVYRSSWDGLRQIPHPPWVLMVLFLPLQPECISSPVLPYGAGGPPGCSHTGMVRGSPALLLDPGQSFPLCREALGLVSLIFWLPPAGLTFQRAGRMWSS